MDNNAKEQAGKQGREKEKRKTNKIREKNTFW